MSQEDDVESESSFDDWQVVFDTSSKTDSEKNFSILFSDDRGYGLQIRQNEVHHPTKNSWRTAFGQHSFSASNGNLIAKYTIKIVKTVESSIEIGINSDTSLKNTYCGNTTANGDNYGIRTDSKKQKFNNNIYTDNFFSKQVKNGDIVVIELNLIDKKVSFCYNNEFIGIDNVKTDNEQQYRLAISLHDQGDCVAIEKLETCRKKIVESDIGVDDDVSVTVPNINELEWKQEFEVQNVCFYNIYAHSGIKK